MKKLTSFLTLNLLLISSITLSAKTWHVSVEGSDLNDGNKNSPVRTISKAAYHAIAGDTVLISGGTYRESVSPANGGINKNHRIVYMAAPGEEVYLKGSEEVTQWEKESKNIWKASVPNSIFGNFNPFATKIFGDWYFGNPDLHLGEIYINGNALKESLALDTLETTPNLWFTEVKDIETIIYANFGEQNPNKSLTEINVRATCFFPNTTGVNYITVKGLNISQAAPQWAPPTGEQLGIIGPNWSKGWVIEDCNISHSKCVGISLGKERASGQNMSSLYKETLIYSKHGFSREIEAVFKAFNLGWSKETIGSHLVKNNVIHSCNQAGIVGHLGCAFSTIVGNEIYNINKIKEIHGFETAGIKLHAAIDVKLEHNLIYDTKMGIWLDWQAQGTHISRNIVYDSEQQDLFLEVSHGPTLVYNNIFLSDVGILVNAQGLAIFNNIVNGRMKLSSSVDRYTPYHEPHSTQIKGLFNNSGGDVRYYNNIFLCNSSKGEEPVIGLSVYDNYPAYSEDLKKPTGGVGNFVKFRFPVWTHGNMYFNNGLRFNSEEEYAAYPEKISCELEKRDGKIYLNISIDDEAVKDAKTLGINTSMLGQTIISEAIFENVDETPFIFSTDFFGRERNIEKPTPGAFEGDLSLPIWE